jgi:hypothetical protein
MKQSIVFYESWNRRWYLIPSHCPVHAAITGTVLGIDAMAIASTMKLPAQRFGAQNQP